MNGGKFPQNLEDKQLTNQNVMLLTWEVEINSGEQFNRLQTD